MDISKGLLDRLAALLKKGPLPPCPDFSYSRDTPFFPPAGAWGADSFFFATVLHLYGLWEEDGRRFSGPVKGRIDGREYTGEDFLWKAAWRAVQEEPDFPLASFQAGLTPESLANLFRDDSGRCPLPLLESHAALARGYGEALQNLKLTPRLILEACRADPDPARKLVAALSDVPGYREDPFRRKSFFLALVLSRRPEKFLQAGAGSFPPVLDRHGLRLALRWGAVRPEDPLAEAALQSAETVPPALEENIRTSAHGAFAEILRRSGRSVPETLGLFLAARDYCPETAAPDCPRCFFFAACERRITFFHPVMRTLNY